jgi:protein associated with RNAse G/E
MEGNKPAERRIIVIFYTRPPNRTVKYRHILLYDGNEGIVSASLMELPGTLGLKEKRTQKHHCPVLWFNFPLAWHNIGAVYDKQEGLIGYYCDILTPIRRIPKGFRTTDLFLDLWVFPDGRYIILDEEEFEEAVRRKWIGNLWRKRAQKELEDLIAQVKEGRFPPSFVRDFLEKLSENLSELFENVERDMKREGPFP